MASSDFSVEETMPLRNVQINYFMAIWKQSLVYQFVHSLLPSRQLCPFCVHLQGDIVWFQSEGSHNFVKSEHDYVPLEQKGEKPISLNELRNSKYALKWFPITCCWAGLAWACQEKVQILLRFLNTAQTAVCMAGRALQTLGLTLGPEFLG